MHHRTGGTADQDHGQCVVQEQRSEHGDPDPQLERPEIVEQVQVERVEQRDVPVEALRPEEGPGSRHQERQRSKHDRNGDHSLPHSIAPARPW